MATSSMQVRVRPGDGLVARQDAGVLFVQPGGDAGVALEFVAALREACAAQDTPGRALARRLVGILSQADPDLLPPFAAAAPTEQGSWAVIVHGAVEVHVGHAAGAETLSGHDAATWVDRLVDGGFSTLDMVPVGVPPGAIDARFDLGSGSVPGGGLRIEGPGAATGGGAAVHAPAPSPEQAAHGPAESQQPERQPSQLQPWQQPQQQPWQQPHPEQQPQQQPWQQPHPEQQPQQQPWQQPHPEQHPQQQPQQQPWQQPHPQQQPWQQPHQGHWQQGGQWQPQPGQGQESHQPQQPDQAHWQQGGEQPGAVQPTPDPAAWGAHPSAAPPEARADGPARAPEEHEPPTLIQPTAAAAVTPAEPSIQPQEQERDMPAADEPFESVLLTDVPQTAKRDPLPVLSPETPKEEVEEDDAPLVWGVISPSGYFNHPDALYCSVTGVSMLHRTHALVQRPRPPLGVMVADDGSTYRLTKDYVVGREPEPDPKVTAGQADPLKLIDQERSLSRVHADIRLVDWDVFVVDRSSANGTYVLPRGAQQWKRLVADTPEKVVPGTRIAFGKRVMTYESHHQINQAVS